MITRRGRSIEIFLLFLVRKIDGENELGEWRIVMMENKKCVFCSKIEIIM